jgi:4-hydroxy-tetrahydrodipicolinate reductase
MKLVVIGARGRLGALIVAAGQGAGVDVVGVGRGDDLGAAVKDGVVVDVSTPGSTRAHVAACVAARAPLLIGTTGLSADDVAAVDEAAGAIPILVAANLSPGAHLVALLAAQAARAMREADVEIVEVHHKKKKDAPSGTALMLAAAVERARGGARIVTARQGEALRQAGDIGVVAVRGGDVVGEHTVSFFVEGERVELAHKVSDRAIFARGALLAARFLSTSKPGRYQMTDVLAAAMGDRAEAVG